MQYLKHEAQEAFAKVERHTVWFQGNVIAGFQIIQFELISKP